MTPRGTLGLCCVYIAQLMTHPAFYTLPFTLQLCYKPQKFHVSSHDGFYTRAKKYFLYLFVIGSY